MFIHLLGVNSELLTHKLNIGLLWMLACLMELSYMIIGNYFEFATV